MPTNANASTVILQTRPQGEKSAERALEQRGVQAAAPREFVCVRSVRNGKRVQTYKETKLLPGYIVASPDTPQHLDNAVADMALREPRKDISRKVGGIAPGAVAHIMKRHLAVVHRDATTFKVGQTVRAIEGFAKGFQVRIVTMTATRIYWEFGTAKGSAPLDHFEAIGP